MIEVQDRNRVEMSQRERDILKVMQLVLDGQRTQVEAARLLQLSVRQVRRIQRKLQAGGDAALVHRLRGQPSNHQHAPDLRKRVLATYRKRYSNAWCQTTIGGSVVGLKSPRTLIGRWA